VGLIWLLAVVTAAGSTSSDWFTRVWNTDDGLLNDQVDAIAQGRDNYLWVVPPVGLMRFDGVRFSRFPLEDFTGPVDNRICCVLCGRTGVFWIATFGGTVIGLKPDLSVVTIPKADLPGAAPLALAEDGAGSLWLGYAGLICRVKDGQVARFGAEQGMPPGKFHSLINDGAGNVWLAKGNQISIFRNGQFQPTASLSDVRCLAATPANGIWLVAGAHLYQCDTNGALRDEGSFPGLSRATARALLEDHSGAVWIGTDGNGLIRHSESGFEKIETSYPSILGLAEDSEGDLWVGTDGGGLDRVSLSAVRLEVLANNPVLEQVQSICEDKNGRLWGTTYNGTLVSRVNGQWTPAFTNAPFAGTATCVAADGGGAVWIGTRDGKLLRVAGTNCPALVQNTYHGTSYALLAASNGDLWIVGYRTLQCWHDGQLEEVKLPRPIERFSAIAEDAAGNIWVGARDIVLRFDGKKFVDESPLLPISGRRVSCLHGTPDGSMWIGCGGVGLLRIKDGRVGRVGIEQGLFDDYISQIVADDGGWLWFGSNHGIFKIRQQELERAMADPGIHLRPVIYGRNEGLSSLAALFSTGLPYTFPRALRTHDGRVWLLTHTGVVVADPRRLPSDATPPVMLTRLAMDGQTIASYGSASATQTVANLKTLSAPLRLPPSHRHLEFDYTAFHFRAPENLHFRYQLAGFDDGWIDAETERHADYSRLAAGNYQLRVAACIGDGPWSEVPATLAFTVTQFFWQTWWFRLGTLLLFTSLVIAVVRYLSFRRMRLKLRVVEQQAAIERERGRIARDIHDDLGNRLTKIQLLTGLLQQDRTVADRAVAHVRQISSAAQAATDALDEIVWAINPRNDTLPHLIDYLGQFTVEFLRTAGIRCRVDLPEQPPMKSVSTEVRHNLFLVLKETLNNIVRHAQATEVSLIVLATDESIRVIIEDNGRGFNGEVKNNGADGLENMRQRMGEIGGEFRIKSTPGKGTWVSFNGPWLAKN
jgi:signal transduction histidine kinase/ligand-binding sensor domain-containing protein